MSSFHTVFPHSPINHYIQYCTAYLRWRQSFLFISSHLVMQSIHHHFNDFNPKYIDQGIISYPIPTPAHSSLNSIRKPQYVKDSVEVEFLIYCPFVLFLLISPIPNPLFSFGLVIGTGGARIAFLIISSYLTGPPPGVEGVAGIVMVCER